MCGEQLGVGAMIYVVFDSAVLIADYRLKKNVHLKALLEESKKGTISVAIPEVVFAEVTNKRLEEHTTLLENLKSNEKRLGLELSATMPRPAEEADRYTKWLRGHLDAHKVRWLCIPDVSHEDLLNYALRKRKPFKENGAGYRDALIWESVKTLAKESGGDVLFLTYDKNDFAAPKPEKAQRQESEKFHPDLVNDLRAARLNPDQITLSTDAGIVVERLVIPAGTAERWFASKMRDDESYRQRIVDSLRVNLDKSIQVLDVDLRHGEVVRHIGDVRPIPDSGRDFKAWVIGRSRIGVELVMEAEIDVVLEVHDQRSRGVPAIAGLGPMIEEAPSERQTIHGLINGQLELPDGQSDQILDAYAYIARLSRTDFRLVMVERAGRLRGRPAPLQAVARATPRRAAGAAA
jgi:predicted nucleic acid-binding protein